MDAFAITRSYPGGNSWLWEATVITLVTREAFRKLPDRRLKYLFSDIQGVPSLIKSNSLSDSAMGYQRIGSEGTSPLVSSVKKIGPRFGLVHFGNTVAGDGGQESDMMEEENIIKQFIRQREEAKLQKQLKAQTAKPEPIHKSAEETKEKSVTKKAAPKPVEAEQPKQKQQTPVLAKFVAAPKGSEQNGSRPTDTKEKVVAECD